MPFHSHHISVQACLLYAGSMSICLHLSIHARELLTARHVLVVFYYLLFSFTQCMSHLRMFQNEGPTIPLGIDNAGRKLKGFQALIWDMHHTWYQDVSSPWPHTKDRQVCSDTAATSRRSQMSVCCWFWSLLRLLRPEWDIGQKGSSGYLRIEIREPGTRMAFLGLQFNMSSTIHEMVKGYEMYSSGDWKQSRIMRHVFHDSMLVTGWL